VLHLIRLEDAEARLLTLTAVLGDVGLAAAVNAVASLPSLTAEAKEQNIRKLLET
jgi:hypothetical protein